MLILYTDYYKMQKQNNCLVMLNYKYMINLRKEHSIFDTVYIYKPL